MDSRGFGGRLTRVFVVISSRLRRASRKSSKRYAGGHADGGSPGRRKRSANRTTTHHCSLPRASRHRTHLGRIHASLSGRKLVPGNVAAGQTAFRAYPHRSARSGHQFPWLLVQADLSRCDRDRALGWRGARPARPYRAALTRSGRHERRVSAADPSCARGPSTSGRALTTSARDDDTR